MTTIAWDGKRLAADRKSTHRGTPMARGKVFLIELGDVKFLVGCAGCTWECLAYIEWMRAGELKVDKPAFSDIEVLRYSKSRGLEIADHRMLWHPISLPIYAIGSGADYAIGAMAMGANSSRAIEIATMYDNATGFGHDEVTL